MFQVAYITLTDSFLTLHITLSSSFYLVSLGRLSDLLQVMNESACYFQVVFSSVILRHEGKLKIGLDADSRARDFSVLSCIFLLYFSSPNYEI